MAANDAPSQCKVILANNIAKKLLEEVHEGLKRLDRKPLLVGFLSSTDPAAKVYADWTKKTAEEKCARPLSKLVLATNLTYPPVASPTNSAK